MSKYPGPGFPRGTKTGIKCPGCGHFSGEHRHRDTWSSVIEEEPIPCVVPGCHCPDWGEQLQETML